MVGGRVECIGVLDWVIKSWNKELGESDLLEVKEWFSF